MNDKIKKLLEIAEMTGGESHSVLLDVNGEKGVTAVISVYKNAKPSHMVLNDLYRWAIENDEQLADFIEELTNDMSWNDVVMETKNIGPIN